MASLEDLTPEARDELAMLARELSENPATRKDFLRITRKAKPNLPIPELDVEDQVRAALTEERTKRESLENQIREKDARDELQRRRDRVAERVGKDNVAEVEKVMLEKGIQNHESAAEYFEWMKQAQAPTPSAFSPNVLDKDTRATLGKFFKAPAIAAREEAMNALRDIRKHKVA